LEVRVGGLGFQGLGSGSSPSPTAPEAISHPKKTRNRPGLCLGCRGRCAGGPCPLFTEIGALGLEIIKKWVKNGSFFRIFSTFLGFAGLFSCFSGWFGRLWTGIRGLERVLGVFGVRIRVLAFRENTRGLKWGFGVSVAVANPCLPFLHFESHTRG
jgi:hypothetical protein